MQINRNRIALKTWREAVISPFPDSEWSIHVCEFLLTVAQLRVTCCIVFSNNLSSSALNYNPAEGDPILLSPNCTYRHLRLFRLLL